MSPKPKTDRMDLDGFIGWRRHQYLLGYYTRGGIPFILLNSGSA